MSFQRHLAAQERVVTVTAVLVGGIGQVRKAIAAAIIKTILTILEHQIRRHTRTGALCYHIEKLAVTTRGRDKWLCGTKNNVGRHSGSYDGKVTIGGGSAISDSRNAHPSDHEQ